MVVDTFSGHDYRNSLLGMSPNGVNFTGKRLLQHPFIKKYQGVHGLIFCGLGHIAGNSVVRKIFSALASPPAGSSRDFVW